MKITVDASVLEFDCTGVGRVLLELYEALMKQHPELRIQFIHRRALKHPLPEGIVSRRMGGLLKARLWRPSVPPLLMFNSDFAHFPWNGGVMRLPGRAKVITTLHDVLPLTISGYFEKEEAGHLYKKSLERDLSRTHLLLTDSHFSKVKIMKNLHSRVEPVVLYPATNLAEHLLINEPPPLPGAYFLYVGGFDRRKNLDLLIEIFTQLHSEKKLAAPLVLIGRPRFLGGGLEQLKKRAIGSGVVIEKDYVSDTELAHWYSHALALVYPSEHEGFGLPPLEAMACGCPVITARASSIPEVCEESAVYIDPRDKKGFAAALIEIEADASFRLSLANQGRIQAGKFSWAESAALFWDLLSKTNSAKGTG